MRYETIITRRDKKVLHETLKIQCLLSSILMEEVGDLNNRQKYKLMDAMRGFQSIKELHSHYETLKVTNS